jgi:hypothetical protein
VVNNLYGERGLVRSDSWPRLPGIYHGSGCTLAAAIAALLANGLSMEDAVHEAQEYTWEALKYGFRPGMGQHIPDRLFWARDEDGQFGGFVIDACRCRPGVNQCQAGYWLRNCAALLQDLLGNCRPNGYGNLNNRPSLKKRELRRDRDRGTV